MKTETSSSQPSSKPGFIKRLLDKLDQSLKAKSDAKAAQPCCCKSEQKEGEDKKCC